jgi:outer membrane protein assembly factor BamB
MKTLSNITLAAAIVISAAAFASFASAQTEVLTRSYDNNRTGANTSEKVFTPQNVRRFGLKMLFKIELEQDDPRIEAQPLYVPGLLMKDGTKHDVLFISSMANKAYAFDINTSAKLWSTSLGKPFLPDPSDAVDVHHINRSFGILSTPVIDRDAGLIYLVNWILDDKGNRALRVNALRLADGSVPADRPPLAISGSVTNAAGKPIILDQVQKQRAALLLTPLRVPGGSAEHKVLYVGFTGADAPPTDGDPTHTHHGWIAAFDVASWNQVGAWVATPSSFGGGIWQGGAGLAADEASNVYAMTSNGGFLPLPSGETPDFVGKTDFAESFVKLKYDGHTLQMIDWYAPFRDSPRRNWRKDEVSPFPRGYNYEDQDLGSAGPVLPPRSNLLLGAGKDGVLYVLDRDNLGKTVGDLTKLKAPPYFITFTPGASVPAYKNAVAAGNLDFKPSVGVKTHHLHSSPVYWESSRDGALLFVWGENEALRSYGLSSTGAARLLGRGTDLASGSLADPTKPNMGGMPGGMLTLSSNGGSNGIVWATAPTEGDANMDTVPGAIRAYDAAVPHGSTTLSKLWEANGFTYSKFCPPVVADGKLIVSTYDGHVDVYVLNKR